MNKDIFFTFLLLLGNTRWSNVRKEGGILAHSLRAHSPWWEGSLGSKGSSSCTVGIYDVACLYF